MPEEAATLIRDNLHQSPTALYETLAKQWKNLTQAQVYAAWSRKSEALWKQNDDPIVSLKRLPGGWPVDVDIFDLAVPNGVTAIAWGVKQVANQIKNIVVEIALDATCMPVSYLFSAPY